MPRTVDVTKREEKEVERMVRPEPKQRAPRMDLRRNRVNLEVPEKDRDTSLNYKEVGGSLAASLRNLASKFPEFSHELGGIARKAAGVANMFGGMSPIEARRAAQELLRELDRLSPVASVDIVATETIRKEIHADLACCQASLMVQNGFGPAPVPASNFSTEWFQPIKD
jgi:hypothetical protein